MPAIARVLYRGGTGLILRETAKRNDDTLVFFGLLLRHGNSPDGMKVVERMNRMHARYPIPNELNLYTLSTLACLPQRLGHQFTGRDIFTGHESLALYHFWRQVGEMMGIRDIPGSPDAMLRWMLDFEAAEYGFTPDGQAVTRALAREYAERWFPVAMRGAGERAFLALFDDRLLATHQLPTPSALATRTGLGTSVGTRNIPPNPPNSPRAPAVSVERTWALMRCLASSAASMSTPAER